MLKLQTIKMASIGLRNFSFSYKGTAILVLEIKPLFFSTCSTMEWTGNFKRHSVQLSEVWDNILMSMSLSKIKKAQMMLKFS